MLRVLPSRLFSRQLVLRGQKSSLGLKQRCFPSVLSSSFHLSSFSLQQQRRQGGPGAPSSPPNPLSSSPLAGASPFGVEGDAQKPPSIVEINVTNFKSVVLGAGPTPVILDCYADWCQPCKALTPKLEEYARKYEGGFILAKLNIDRNQDIAGSLNITSIPVLFIIHEGKFLDKVVGVPPDDKLQELIETVVQKGGFNLSKPKLQDAEKSLVEGNVQEAVALFQHVLQDDSPEIQLAAFSGLARCALAQGNKQEAEQILEELFKKFPQFKESSEVKQVQASLELFSSLEGLPALSELQQRVKSNENDLQAKFDISKYLAAEGKNAEAIEQLLSIVRKERKWSEGAATKQLLKLFEALGTQNDLVIRSRKRLTSLMF